MHRSDRSLAQAEYSYGSTRTARLCLYVYLSIEKVEMSDRVCSCSASKMCCVLLHKMNERVIRSRRCRGRRDQAVKGCPMWPIPQRLGMAGSRAASAGTKGVSGSSAQPRSFGACRAPIHLLAGSQTPSMVGSVVDMSPEAREVEFRWNFFCI